MSLTDFPSLESLVSFDHFSIHFETPVIQICQKLKDLLYFFFLQFTTSVQKSFILQNHGNFDEHFFGNNFVDVNNDANASPIVCL